MARLVAPSLPRTRLRYEGYGLHMGGQTSAGSGTAIESCEAQHFGTGAREAWKSLPSGISACQSRIASRTHAIVVHARNLAASLSAKHAFATRATSTFANLQTVGESLDRTGGVACDTHAYLGSYTGSTNGFKHTFATDAGITASSLTPTAGDGQSFLQTSTFALVMGGGTKASPGSSTKIVRFANDSSDAATMLGSLPAHTLGACASFAGLGLIVSPYTTGTSVLNKTLNINTTGLMASEIAALASGTPDRAEGGALSNPRGAFVSGNASASTAVTRFKLANNLAAETAAALATGRRSLGGVSPSSNPSWVVEQFTFRGAADALQTRGNLFNAGGNNGGWANHTTNTEKQTLATDAKASATSLNAGRSGQGTSNGIGFAVICGGLGPGNLSSIERYNTETEVATTRAATNNINQTVGSGTRTKGFNFGGVIDGGSCSASVERIDYAASDARTRLSNALLSSAYNSGAIGTGSLAFVLGGRNSEGTVLSTVLNFNFETEYSSTAASITAAHGIGQGSSNVTTGIRSLGADASNNLNAAVTLYGLVRTGTNGPSAITSFNLGSAIYHGNLGGSAEAAHVQGGFTSTGMVATGQATKTWYETLKTALAFSLTTARGMHSTFSSAPGELVPLLKVPTYAPALGSGKALYTDFDGVYANPTLRTFGAATGTLEAQSYLVVGTRGAADHSTRAEGFSFAGETSAFNPTTQATRLRFATGTNVAKSVLNSARRYTRGIGNQVQAVVVSGFGGSAAVTQNWEAVKLATLATWGESTLTQQGAPGVFNSPTDGFVQGGSSSGLGGGSTYVTSNRKHRFSTHANSALASLGAAKATQIYFSFPTRGMQGGGLNSAGTAQSTVELTTFASDALSSGNALASAQQSNEGTPTGAGNATFGLMPRDAQGKVSMYAGATDAWTQRTGWSPFNGTGASYGVAWSTHPAWHNPLEWPTAASFPAFGYVFGGTTGGQEVAANSVQSIYKFTDASSTWAAQTGRLATAAYLVFGLGNQEQGILIGGYGGGAYLNQSQVVDYSQDAVEASATALSTVGQRGHAYTFSTREVGYSAAGATTGGSWIQTSSKLIWATMADLSANNVAAAVIQSNAGTTAAAGYAIGGVFSGGTRSSAVYRYTWQGEAASTLGASLGTARASHTGQGMQSSTHLYQVGGGISGGSGYARTTARDKFAFATEAVTALSALGTARYTHSALSMPTRGLLVAGLSGSGSANTDIVDTVDVTDFSNDAQATTTSLPAVLGASSGLAARLPY